MLEEQTLLGPVGGDRLGNEVVEGEIGGLGTIEDRALEIGCEECEADQSPTILGLGGSAAHRQVPGIELDHGVGTLERADQDGVAACRPDSG